MFVCDKFRPGYSTRLIRAVYIDWCKNPAGGLLARLGRIFAAFLSGGCKDNQPFFISTIAMFLVLCVAPVGAKGRRQHANGNVKNYSESLILTPNAINPRFRKYPDGRQQVWYIIDVPYPAKGVLRYISIMMSKHGWKPLRHNFLNPEIPSSAIRGWQETEDKTENPTVAVRGWGTDWENAAHDVTEYNLEYRFRYPKSGPPELRKLRVIALYIPAGVVNSMRRRIGSARPGKQ